MTLPVVITSDRLRLPLWTADEAADILAGRHRQGWHRDYPRQDDRDAATMFHEGDPWAPRHVVRGDTALGSIGCYGPPSWESRASPTNALHGAAFRPWWRG